MEWLLTQFMLLTIYGQQGSGNCSYRQLTVAAVISKVMPNYMMEVGCVVTSFSRVDRNSALGRVCSTVSNWM